MSFSELLNQYIEDLGCSAKELADASGLSAAVISRYRAGSRVPAAESDSLVKLTEGIARLSDNTPSSSSDAIMKKFTEVMKNSDFDYDRFAENLNLLIETAGLNINRLARYVNYDASFISRIRTGQRRPAEPRTFADDVCRYVSTNAIDKISEIAALIGKPAGALTDQRVFYNALRHWICSETTKKSDQVDHFLTKLDEFDLNDYIRSIHFDTLKVPTVPFQLPKAKTYIGIEQMRTGELDFFKATVLSHASDSIFMYSDMDMEDMAKDVEFGKKWMFAIAMCLKKGLHLDVIHTVDRPFDEMMLGLESWMPIYMTGQISPYYLKNARSHVYQHLNYVSGAAALVGDCVAGHHKKGRYYLTNRPDEIAYFREKSQFILKKALPLMEIFRSEHKQSYDDFIRNDSKASGNRHEILSVPPIYTMPDDLLCDILSRSDISEDEKNTIRLFVNTSRKHMEQLVADNVVLTEIPRISRKEFDEYPCYLPLEGLFFEKDIAYRYEDYLRHLDATTAFAKTHKNYTAQIHIRRCFRRMQITIHEGEFALISKGKSPVIHFVIRHEKLRDAIQNLVMPIVDEPEMIAE